jgi:hypothetical protein
MDRYSPLCGIIDKGLAEQVALALGDYIFCGVLLRENPEYFEVLLARQEGESIHVLQLSTSW